MKAELCGRGLPSLCRMETQDLGSWTWRLSATHREACPRSKGQSQSSGPQPLGGRVSAWCVCVNPSCPWRDFWLKGCSLLSADKGAAASLEQKLREVDEECRVEERRRVDLELSIVEVKDSLRKAEAGPVTLGTTVDTTHLESVSPRVSPVPRPRGPSTG